MLLELIKSVIGLSLLGMVMCFAQYMATSPEYRHLVAVTESLLGTLNYQLDRTLRQCWKRLYELEDSITGYKPTNISYFN